MADEPSTSPSPFDVKTIEALIALMAENDLSEIDLRDGAQRVRLRRGGNDKAMPTAPIPVIATAPAPAPLPVAPPAPPAAPASKNFHEIKSPTPGTFYSAANPGADPFVRAGSRVTATSVVCLIEAMKIFNEIPADCNGVITEILVENQQPVEYGQVLFRVDPTG